MGILTYAGLKCARCVQFTENFAWQYKDAIEILASIEMCLTVCMVSHPSFWVGIKLTSPITKKRKEKKKA